MDSYSLESSANIQELTSHEFDFTKRQWRFCADQNSGSYQAGSVMFNLDQVTAQNISYVDWQNSYLFLPLC